jgi:heme oxygenase
VPHVLGSTRAATATSAVERLRAHTLEAHVRLEERLGRFEWVATLETYASMLERFYGFYVSAEPQLAAVAGVIPGLELGRRRKAPLLEQDLTALGRTSRQLRALARIGRVPLLDSPANALGTLYVLEGATLGGKLIEQEVGRRLALDRSTGTAFFGAYGSDAAREWKRFGAILERETRTLDLDAVCESAEATFATLDGWLR